MFYKIFYPYPNATTFWVSQAVISYFEMNKIGLFVFMPSNFGTIIYLPFIYVFIIRNVQRIED